MKIAIFVQSFPCLSETFILNQILYLTKQGHTVHIYAFQKDTNPINPQIEANNLLAVTKYMYHRDSISHIESFVSEYLDSKKNFYFLSFLGFFGFYKNAIVVKKYFENIFQDAPEYDIIHAHFGIMGKVVVLLKKLGIMQQTPLLTSFHGYDINPKYIERHTGEYIELFKKSSLITANSTFTINLLKQANCPLSKLVKLPESFDVSFFQKNNKLIKDTNFINVVFCGRLIEFKAPELVVEIANILINKRGNKNIKFHIIGGGTLHGMVVNAIEKYDLQNYITMYGPKTQDAIIDIMSAMDIFLYPGINDKLTGRAENQGLILQEAQALELPIITSNVGGIAEGVIDEVTAFVLVERDLESFVDKIEILANDKNRRLEMGKQGRDYVSKKFDYNVLGKQLEEFYRSCFLK